MAIDERMYEAQQDQEMMMPGTDVHDPLTYDPTQGQGTPAWQEAVRRQKELNMRLKANANFRRN